MVLDEDGDLVRRFRAGEVEAFERLYHKYYQKVYSIARSVVLNSEDAADVAQEVFSLAYKNISGFDNRSRFGTWLHRIAVNRSIQEQRKLRLRRNTTPLDEAKAIAETPTEQPIDPDVKDAMMSLPPADRVILGLFYWEEKSLQEIAEIYSIQPNAAKTRLYRARERFRLAYERRSR